MLHSATLASKYAHEINQMGYSYTSETLAELKQAYPNTVFYFLPGMDSYLSLNQWRQWQTLTDYANLVIYERPKIPTHNVPLEIKKFAEKRQCSLQELMATKPTRGTICQITVPQIPLSSTLLRQRMHLLAPITDSMIPQDVLKFINQHHIYDENTV